MNRAEFLKREGFKGAGKWTAADQIRVCRLALQARDFETELNLKPGEKMLGSRFVDRDAKELNIKIGWR